jgi:hypothetical protein
VKWGCEELPDTLVWTCTLICYSFFSGGGVFSVFVFFVKRINLVLLC